jgi:hypothetical protein
MGTYYRQDEVFPLITRIIDEFSQHSSGYMKHGEIVDKMKNDDEARLVLERLPKRQTADWWASNMVQWFSQSITVARSKWRYDFDRQPIEKNGHIEVSSQAFSKPKF